MSRALVLATASNSFNNQLIGCANLVCDKVIVVNVGYDINNCGDIFINLNLEESMIINFREVTKTVVDIALKYEISHLIVASNNYGKTIGPRIATSLKSGMIAEVESITDGNIYTRPAYQNSKKADIIFKDDSIKVFSVKHNAFKVSSTVKECQVINSKQIIKKLNYWSRKKQATSLLPGANIVVSGGKGAITYYDKVKILANRLNWVHAGSRELTDINMISRQEQVGQSGFIIKPNLYLAIGISGTYQHIIGIKDVKHIMVVNIDDYAPICSLADFVVIGNGEVFIDKLLKYMEVL